MFFIYPLDLCSLPIDWLLPWRLYSALQSHALLELVASTYCVTLSRLHSQSESACSYFLSCVLVEQSGTHFLAPAVASCSHFPRLCANTWRRDKAQGSSTPTAPPVARKDAGVQVPGLVHENCQKTH